MKDRIQRSRFELKYVVSQATALEIRDWARRFLDLDEYSEGQPDFAYPVHSLYLDSEAMKTYWDTVNGNKNRFKLRVRFYTDDPHGPVFFEIKRRMNHCILKERAAVHREAAPSILTGQMPSPEALWTDNSKHLAALQHFCRLVRALQASPTAHVAYFREAYMPAADNPARLTLDRAVCWERDESGCLSTAMWNPILIWGNAVVLELKFTDRYPNWFGDLVRTFDLRQCGAAKYADGVTLMEGRLPQHQRMPRPNRDWHWPRVERDSVLAHE